MAYHELFRAEANHYVIVLECLESSDIPWIWGPFKTMKEAQAERWELEKRNPQWAGKCACRGVFDINR